MHSFSQSKVQKSKYADPTNISKYVKVWLVIGLLMIFVQVIVGGITRLTGSGLSITKWEIVTGTLPPLSTAAWEHEFDLYKATPQYQKINQGMSLSEFKFIYFWEYFHRLWARSMGFVFAIPFFYFWRRKMFSKELIYRLGIVVLLAMLVASVGWIMVASGLVDRPWVNAYKLAIHLSLGFLLFCYLLWTTFRVFQPHVKVIHNSMLRNTALVLTVFICIQVIFGGIMSGMKAGLFFPTWPDMNGDIFPEVFLQSSNWTVENFVNYDSNSFMPSLIQLLHRSTAYLLIIICLYFTIKSNVIKGKPNFTRTNIMLISVLIVQVLLGIFTLINCIGSIPVGLGVLHQAGALLLLSVALYANYQLGFSRST